VLHVGLRAGDGRRGDGDPDAPASPSMGWWVLYVVASALAVYTHLYASFVLLAQWLSLAVRPRSVPWCALLASGVALAVLLVPMAVFLLSGPHATSTGSEGHGKISRASGTPCGRCWGAAARSPRADIWSCAWPCCAWRPRRCGVRSRHTRGGRISCPLLWFVTPIAIPLAVSLTIKPVLDPRLRHHLRSRSSPARGRGLRTAGRMADAVGGGAHCGRAVRGLGVFRAAPEEDWRGATRTMVAESLPGDVAIFYAPYVRRPFDYYASHTPASHSADPANASGRIAELYPSARYSDFTLDSVVPLSLAGAVDSARSAPRAWVVLSHTLRADSTCAAAIDAALRPTLHQLRDLHFAGGVEVRLYARHQGRTRYHPARPASLGGACPQA